MSNLQTDSKSDVVKVEQHEQSGSASRPNFDVLGLLKEGAQSAGAVGKELVNGVVSTAKDFENHFIDVPDISSNNVQPAAYNTSSRNLDDDTEQTCEGDIGVALMFPAGIAGLFAGLKGGLEAGFLVAGPPGAEVGGAIGMFAGTVAGVGAAFYSSHKGCEWMSGLSHDYEDQQYNNSL